jgi:AcrR family transcriptional regulator
MPPQVNFTQDMILDTAFEIVRKKGLEALSARTISQKLHCSTRPIYTAFQSMKALETLVIEKAREYAIQYMLQEEGSELFLAIGLQYFRFAQEEKELFKILYMSKKEGLASENFQDSIFGPLLERMKQDPHLQAFDDEQLQTILFKMQVFTHGLATLACTGALTSSEEFIRDCLYQMGQSVIAWEYYKDKVEWENHLHECK